MRTTIRIDDGVLAEAKLRAREKRCSLGDVINEALRVGLFSKDNDKKSGKPRPLRTFGRGGVQSGVDLRDSAALLERMEGE